MVTMLCKIVGGMNGYVPVKSDSHGGVDLGRAMNGKEVYKIVDVPIEQGYVQVDKRIITDLENIKVSPTGEYWVENSHLEKVVIDVPSTVKRKYIIEITEVTE